MRNRLITGLLIWLLSSAGATRLGAQMSDDEKRNLFLKAREDIHPVPRASASPTPRPKPKTVSSPTPTPKPVVKEEEEEPKPRKTPPKEEDEPTPKPHKTPAKEEDEEPTPKPHKATPTPAPEKEKEADRIPLETETAPKSTPVPKATPPQIPQGKTPSGIPLNAPILIEKSGAEADQGYEAPAPSTGGWFKRWRYLSPSVRKQIDVAKVKKGRWKYIVVHNSGTRQGNAKIFDVYHRKVRKMQNGLAYHFVIGNGSSSGDGEIEIGNRWTQQINGGHVASDYLNNIALGICLVGDLNRDTPTPAQMAALDELITYLRGRVGKIKGKPAIVLPHKIINPKPTDCPGDRFPYKWLSSKFGS